jgi:hypothetical protein
MRFIAFVLAFFFMCGTAQAVQNDWRGFDFSCMKNTDCFPFNYNNCCRSTTCIDKLKTIPNLEVQTVCSAKVDCKVRETSAVFQGCQCVDSMCQSVFIDQANKTIVVPAPVPAPTLKKGP